MRRIDVLSIGLGVFAGGLVYAILQLAGLDSLEAGVESTVVGWWVSWLALTYTFQAVNQKMTYQQQQDYEEAFLKKRLEITPELAQIQAEIDQEQVSSVDKTLRDQV